MRARAVRVDLFIEYLSVQCELAYSIPFFLQSLVESSMMVWEVTSEHSPTLAKKQFDVFINKKNILDFYVLIQLQFVQGINLMWNPLKVLPQW